MKFLFCPQNASHQTNMTPVAELLANQGHETHYLNLNPVFKQHVEFNETAIVITYDYYQFNIPFYQLSFTKKIQAIYSFASKMGKTIVNDYDSIIVGNDGAMQRVLIISANQLKKKSYLILDAMVSDTDISFFDVFKGSSNLLKLKYYMKQSAVNLVSSLFQNHYLGCYLPSKIAKTELSKIFVTGDLTKNAVQSWNKKSKVISTGIPRHGLVVTTKKSTNNSNVVYFLTTAYKWHGHTHLHLCQLKALDCLCNVVEEYNLKNDANLEIHVKVHPRDEESDFQELGRDVVKTISKKLSLELIYSSDSKIFTTVSSCIVEALRYRKTIHAILIYHPTERYKKSFISSDSISKIYHAGELYNILNRPEELKDVVDTHLINIRPTQKIVDTIVNEIV